MAKNATGFSDPELIYLYRCGNYKAIEILKNKHGGAINDIASKLLSVCYNLNFEDVIQELNYAFLKAVEMYSEKKGRFFSYAYCCVSHYAAKMLKDYFSEAEYTMRNAVSLNDYCSEDGSLQYIEIIENDITQFDPVYTYEVRESEEKYQLFVSKLKKKDKKIHYLQLDGLKTRKIAKITHFTVRSVRNRMCKIKKEVTNFIKN